MRKQKLDDKIRNLSDNIVYELFKVLMVASTKEVTFMHHWESELGVGLNHHSFIRTIWAKGESIRMAKFKND